MERVKRYVTNIKSRAQSICDSQNIKDEKSKYCVYRGIVHWEMSREMYPIKAMLSDHVQAHKCADYSVIRNEIVFNGTECEIAKNLYNEISNIQRYWLFIGDCYHQF